mgnify:CR=1 FL=1
MIKTPWDEVAARYDSNKLTKSQLAEVAAQYRGWQMAYRQGYRVALETQEVRQLIYEAESAANVCQSFDHPYTAESVRKSLAALEGLRKEAQE